MRVLYWIQQATIKAWGRKTASLVIGVSWDFFMGMYFCGYDEAWGAQSSSGIMNLANCCALFCGPQEQE